MGDAAVPHTPSGHKGAKLRFEHRRTNWFPAALRLPTGVLPRKRLAYSAPGGASPLSPLETPLRRKGWASAPAFGNHPQRIESGSGKRSRWCPLCSQINAIPADARMQLFKEHLSAQLAGDFWILSAVRTGRSFVWVSRPPAANSSLTFFLFHRTRRIFFLMSQKENGGCIPTGKACIPAAVRCILTGMFPCWKQRKFWGHSSRQSRDSVRNQQ